MTTLRIENTVHDYSDWKAAFDKYERTRAQQGVRAYRVSRRIDDPHQITVDLDFDDAEAAANFRELLFKIWQTPQSRAQLTAHSEPAIYELAEVRTL